MARRKGSLDLDSSIELSYSGPLDARGLVRTKEEQLDPASFEYGYKGLLTVNRDEEKLYLLSNHQNPTQETSWKVIGPYDDSALDARVTALENASPGEQVQADWEEADATSKAYIQNKPTFATVATSGSYNDLSDQPTIPEPYDDSALDARVTALENAPSTAPTWNDVTGKPDFANVATSGSYNDLGDKPSIPEAYDDTEVRNLIAGKANSADLAPVATSGSYNDLGDKPTIPEAYDDTEVRGLIAAKANSADLATVATSGSYNDLGDKPTIPAAYDDTEVRGLIAAKANSADLAAVATSGSYNDLGDKPTIPSAYDDTALAARVTAVEADLGGLATVATSGSYNDLSDKPTIPAEVTVDDAMSDASENPVQNKVVLAAIGDAIDVVEANVYTKSETDALLDGKASLQVAAIPGGGGGGEEISATVSQGTDSVNVNYYKDSELPTALNLNVGEDDFRIPTTAYVDTEVAKKGNAKITFDNEYQYLQIRDDNGTDIGFSQETANTVRVQEYAKDDRGQVQKIFDETLASKTYVDGALADKQDALVSGTNIKTFNGESLLGDGDIPIPAYVGSGWGVAKVGSVNATTTMTPITVDISDLRLGSVDDYQVAVSISGSEASSNYKVVVVKTNKDSFTITTSAHVFTVNYTVFAKGYGGVPNGGMTGQVLAKKSNADGDTEWVPGGGGINIKVGEEKWQGTYTDENNETFQVYSKMVYIPALPATAGVTTYDHGVANIKQILNIYGFTTDGFVLNAPRQNVQDNITIYQASKSATNQTFSIEVGKDRSSKKAYVVMVYAKNN